MAKTIWDDEGPFRDGAPVFEQGEWKEPETYTPAPDTAIRASKVQEVNLAQQKEEELKEMCYEKSEEVSDQDDEEDYTEVLSDARLRLEQGKLYEMIMNHDLFNGVDADPRAAKSVQKQIRKFAKEQMEVMLGMRQTTILSPELSVFNNLEVKALRDIANKLIVSSGLSPEESTEVVHAQSKKKTLNTISSSKQRVSEKQIQKKVEPIKRNKNQLQRSLPPEFEPDYEPLNKPIHEMTQQELIERDKQALERQRNRKSAVPVDRAPMPDYATQEMIAANQVARATGSGSPVTSLNGKLSSLILTGAIKKV